MFRVAAAWACVALGLAACAAALPVDAEPITVNAHNRLIDGAGRELLFHGANVVVKGAPWLPGRGAWSWNESFVAKDMALMESFGLNMIRLGVMWPGVEPARGQVNHTYLAELAALVEEASAYGISALMDMHQDLLSGRFCGEGLPLWAVGPTRTDFPAPVGPAFNATAATAFVPTAAQCHSRGWGAYYGAAALGEGYQALYDDPAPWVAFWRAAVAALQPLGGAVLGWELINEPYAGDVARRPDLMHPGVADRVNLAPFYNAAADAIHAIDAKHAIFFEAFNWAPHDFGAAGFASVPGGAAWANRSVLSYHYYAPLPSFDGPREQLRLRQADMARLGCGGFLTEFAVTPCKGCGPADGAAAMDAADEFLQSTAWWEWKPFRGGRTGAAPSIFLPDGTVNETVARAVSRTYAPVVAGHATRMRFNATTAAFVLTYVTQPRAAVTNRTTEVYLNEALHYAGGYTATLSTPHAVTRSRRNHIAVTHSAALPAGTAITLTVVALTSTGRG
jgi:endoglycosylceramidase